MIPPYTLVVNPAYEAILATFKKNNDQYKRLVKNWRTFIPKNLDTDLSAAQAKAFETIDCMDCGNCCRALGPRVKPRDIPPLAKSLGMKPARFEEEYLRLDEEGDMIFRTRPCPFVGDDNACFVYHDRPWACRAYPHLDQRNQMARLNEVMADAEICPAVALALESMLPKENPLERPKRKDQ